MPALKAKDLTRETPRSPYEELDGIPWLARLIDKVRALDVGTLGEYTPFPCGGDRGFLAAVGIAPDDLKAVISRGAGDAEIAAWVRQHAPADLESRLAKYRAAQRSAVTGDYADYLSKATEKLHAEQPTLDLRPIDNFSRLICVEEGHPLP